MGDSPFVTCDTIYRAWRGARVVLGLVGLSACGASQRPATLTTYNCTGQRILEVRNTLDVPVDIFVVPTAARGSPEFLATVRPGVTRLPLAEPLYFSYALRDDREFVSRREVDVRYDCDQS